MLDTRCAPRTYARYAALFLAGTVLAGVWLRTATLRPDALAGFSFRNLVHAHSHLAFFGWVTMALFAVILRGSGGGRRWGWRLHPHLVGIASVAAFAGFLEMGYAPPTLVLSAVHVALWGAFAAVAWPALARGGGAERPFFLAALAFLLIAGAGSAGTGMLAARTADPWSRRLAIELFLTPFTAGWLVLGAFGAAYARLARPRFARAVLLLAAAGALPSGLLHIAAPAPSPWLPMLGRAGTLLVGTATLAFAADVLRDRGASPLLRLAGAAALAKGAAEVTAALGLALHLMGSQPVVIAYLHLVLLGMVTSVLADALLGSERAAAPAALHAAGLCLQLGALLVMGWMPLLGYASALGWGVGRLLGVALAGGILSAAALVAVAVRVLAAPAPLREVRRETPRAEPRRERSALTSGA